MSEAVATQAKEEFAGKRGLSGSTLKLLALVTMLIDHIGAALIARVIISDYQGQGAQFYEMYLLMRSIGRIAFPIYCFLLVEGFLRTRSRMKYALRLLLFAFISEIPFDLAFSAKVFAPGYQNIFFTLLIGLLAMMVASAICDKLAHTDNGYTSMINTVVLVLCSIVAIGAAELLKTDYSGKGVACIMVLYLFRGTGVLQKIAGAVAFCWELPAPLAFLPIAFYNGRRGMPMKYIFYVFYPLHLLVIYFICMYLGIAGYAVV